MIRRLLIVLLLVLSAVPAKADTVLQAFWWDCWNESSYAPGKDYRYEWYNYIRAQLPRLEAVGITGMWTPPPSKAGNSAGNSMGYDVYDHYDIGDKPYNQPPSKPDGRTRFGTRDEFLRLVASAHAHGIEIYPDIVLNHMSGGKEDPGSPKTDAAGRSSRERWKSFRYPAAGGPEAGRWPKSWWQFHPNPEHDTVNSSDLDYEMWGPDICYLSDHDAFGTPSKSYMLKQAENWLEWFSKLTGVDGYRFDAVRHYEPFVVRDLLKREEEARGRKPFSVAEFADWNTGWWIKETEGRSRTFDFHLRDELYNMVFKRGFYNIGSLPDAVQQEAHSVSFVNSMDTYRGAAGNASTIPPEDPWAGLAYAFILSIDRTPLVFYEDLFPNRSPQLRRFGNPSTRPMRQWLADLIKMRERYASGHIPVKYLLRTDDLLVLERPGKMVTVLNDNGADWKEIVFTTSFGPGIELKDITGQTNTKVKTQTGADAGKVSLWLPPVSYAVLVKASEPPLFPVKRAARFTVQEIEFADDLSTGCLSSKPNKFRIWPAPGAKIDAELKLSEPAKAAIELIGPDGKPCPAVHTFDGGKGSWKAGKEGWHTFKVKVSSTKRMPACLKVYYMGAR